MTSLSISRQIYLATGCALTLLALLAGLSYAATIKLAEVFSGYQETAQQTIVANELLEEVFDTQIAALSYRIAPSADQAERVDRHTDDIKKRLEAAQRTLARNDVALDLAQQLSQLTEGYDQALSLITSSMSRSERVVASLSSIEAAINDRLDTVMTFAQEHGNTWLGRVTRLAQDNFTRGHFLNERFLLTDDISTFESALSSLEEARSQVHSLHPTIYDVEIQDLAFEAIGQLSAYIDAVKENRDLVVMRNSELYPRLDALGAKSRSDLDLLLTGAVDHQQEMGALGTERAAAMLDLVIFISIFALGIGSALGVLVARNVSGSVRDMADTMAELAGGNLDVEVKGTEEQHELGMMARALAVFKSHAENLRRALDKERELSGMQRQFVSMVSHEFRTPLAVIDANAQRLQRRPEEMASDRGAKRIGSIRTSVLRLTDLMESVLVAARLEDGKIRFEPEAFDVREMVAEVCRNYDEISRDHRIEPDLDGLPESYEGDAKLLRQVISNLVSNAVKYSPDGTHVWVRGTTKSDGHLVISVEDKGVGIPEEELEKLFDRFFRASTSTGIPGSGIGLHLVKQLVDLHQGRMNVRSKIDEGTTFEVWLPPVRTLRPTAPDAEDGQSGPSLLAGRAA